MAEALAAIGAVASIVQLVDFGNRVLRRLNEYRSKAGDLPDSFHQIATDLPLLIHTLEITKDAIDGGRIDEKTEKALSPVIDACQKQVEELNQLLERILPTGDSWRNKTAAALKSVQKESNVEKIQSAIRGRLQTLTHYHATASSTALAQKDEILSKIQKWLSPPDPYVNHNKAFKQCLPDTGRWFIEGSQYTEWKTKQASFLWLHGIPGCGKTILSSSIIQDLIQRSNDDPTNAVAFYYFDFNDIQKQRVQPMLKSIVAQLSKQCQKVPSALESLFSSCNDGSQEPSTEALCSTLSRMIPDYSKVHLVLDALDECAEREDLLDTLEQLASLNAENFHMLVTSRAEHDIELALRPLLSENFIVPLQIPLINEDIRRYIRHRWSNDRYLERWERDHSIQREVEETLMEKADGMFRWVACQLDSLGKCVNRLKLRKSLQTLPPTLDETYERILRSIDEDNAQYALRILTWLVYSQKPLRLDELAEVVAIDVENYDFNTEEVLPDPSDVIAICSSLVAIGEDTGYEKSYVKLAHYSVKEYLVSERIKNVLPIYHLPEKSSHVKIGKGCLIYLLRFYDQNLSFKDLCAQFPLAQYSAFYWIDHLRYAERNTEEMNPLFRRLLSSSDYVFRYRWLFYYRHGFANRLPRPLYLAAFFGLEELVRVFLAEHVVDVNEKNKFGTALHAASVGSYVGIVNELIQAGADINVRDKYKNTALQKASYQGSTKIVELLLSRGADPNLQGGKYGSALYAASFWGHQEIVKLLLSASADPNLEGGEYGTALQAASAGGHQEIVKLLLDARADPNLQGGDYGTALQGAVNSGVMIL